VDVQKDRRFQGPSGRSEKQNPPTSPVVIRIFTKKGDITMFRRSTRTQTNLEQDKMDKKDQDHKKDQDNKKDSEDNEHTDEKEYKDGEEAVHVQDMTWRRRATGT